MTSLYYDEMTPTFTALAHISREVAFEQLADTGYVVRTNIQRRMKSSTNRHHWFQKSENGKLVPYYNSSATKELGGRTNKDGSTASPDSMSDMIHSTLFEKSGVLVINGAHPAMTPLRRKDGKVIGFEKRLSSVGLHTQSIIHKLNTGERNEDHGWGKNGVDETPYYPNAKFKGRHFVEAGITDSRAVVKQNLTTAYDKTIGRAVNKLDIKPIKHIKKA